MLNKTLDQWLAEYGESHQNPRNKLIHWICVPVILWCVLALLWPLKIGDSTWLNGATALIAISILFYLRLSLPLAAGMVAISALSVWLIIAYQAARLPWPLWSFALALFVLAWIGQFIGHKIEGKKPSFFKDIQFLLIGPAWLLHNAFKRLNG
jgi:uncharacterized membrane protein YGL010W